MRNKKIDEHSKALEKQSKLISTNEENIKENTNQMRELHDQVVVLREQVSNVTTDFGDKLSVHEENILSTFVNMTEELAEKFQITNETLSSFSIE